MAQIEVYHVFKDKVNENKRIAVLEGEEAHHLGRVRRAREGQIVWLIDGSGRAWSAQVKSLNKREIILDLNEKFENWNEPKYKLNLGLGILKGDKFNQAIDLAVQLGIFELTALKTQFSIGDLSANKFKRAEAYALKAAKQCSRGRIPSINETQPLEKFCIKAEEYDHRFMLHPDGSVVPELKQNVSIAAVIGSEGGFSVDEEKLMTKHNFQPISLGKRRLRSETAVAAFCSIIESRTILA